MNLHRITIGDTTVICNGLELDTLNSVCKKFMDCEIDSLKEDDESHSLKIMFSELNVTEKDEQDFCVSCWGDDGYRLNSVADEEALQEFGVYFNVLMFLDSCTSFFRTDDRDCLE